VFVVSAPVIGIAAVGYQVALARRVAGAFTAPLPDWDDLGWLFRQGFWLALARLLYELPARVLVLATLLLALRPLYVASQAGLPLSPGPAWQSVQTLLLGGLAVLLYNLAYGFLSPAITAQFARRGSLRACFAFGSMARFIARHPRAYLQVWAVREAAGLAARLAGLGLGFILGPLPLLGPLAGAMSWGWLLFVSLLLNGCLVGQLLQLEAGRPQYELASTHFRAAEA
jgi:hypothetical protein